MMEPVLVPMGLDASFSSGFEVRFGRMDIILRVLEENICAFRILFNGNRSRRVIRLWRKGKIGGSSQTPEVILGNRSVSSLLLIMNIHIPCGRRQWSDSDCVQIAIAYRDQAMPEVRL